MDEEKGAVEWVRDVVGGINEAWWFLFMFVIGIAFVVMGNTFGRLIGIAILATCFYIAIRLARRWRAD